MLRVTINEILACFALLCFVLLCFVLCFALLFFASLCFAWHCFALGLLEFSCFCSITSYRYHFIIFTVCNTPTPPANGHLTGAMPAKLVYLTRLKYACSTGYHLAGPAEIYCDENGRWNEAVPACNGTCSLLFFCFVFFFFFFFFVVVVVVAGDGGWQGLNLLRSIFYA